jgi:hypothetical protein
MMVRLGTVAIEECDVVELKLCSAFVGEINFSWRSNNCENEKERNAECAWNLFYILWVLEPAKPWFWF